MVTQLKQNGFSVKADLPNFVKPAQIGGFVPDVEAHKGVQKVIGEVETKDSMASDIDQRRAFRTNADALKNTTFKLKKV